MPNYSEPEVTKFGWAIGLSPENRTIGKKIINKIPIKPSQPIDLNSQFKG